MKKFPITKVRARAPLRLGLAGGGTDLSPYCDEFTGYVLNATIDRYAYCTIESSNDDTITFISTDRQKNVKLNCKDYPFTLNNEFILHKATYNRLIKEYHKDKPVALKLITYCDAPMGSGLGSSSTIVVAMIKAFEEFLKIGLDDYRIAHLAYEVERIDCALTGGRQDQYSATFGGFNFMEFSAKNHVLVNPLRIRNWIRCELESSLILHYTGKSRESANIIDSQLSNFKKSNETFLQEMHNIKNAAFIMKEALLKGDFATFVEYLNLSWQNKKNSSTLISNPLIDEKFEIAMRAGALAGKVSGAGGGGFIMFFTRPEKRGDVINALAENGGWTSNCHFTKMGSECWRV